MAVTAVREISMQSDRVEKEVERGLSDRFHTDEVLALDLVSAFAGDRPLDESEKALLDDLKKNRGEAFFPDLLYAITHAPFPPATAEGLWNQILRHKFELSAAVRRNVGVAVAALDYLSNLKGELKSPTLMGEAHVADITRLVLRDGLTRLFNHTTCLEKIAVEMRIYQRYGRTSSLMMVDVDDFKKVNDQYGHTVGDKVLATLGEIIDKETRDSDICCRYGGEEFAMILPETETQEAGLLAERLRVKVEHSMPAGRKVSISIGVATCGKNTRTAQALVDKADAALYRAKKRGKNCVEVSA